MAMKFRAHDTFFVRKGWLSKGMKYVDKNPDVFVDKNENPMDVLGIGSNMVKALRYWLQAVGLTEEPNHGKRSQTFTPFGAIVFSNDRYIEELGTLFLLQYRLSSNREDATAWYFFFNEFSMSEFTREDFVASLQNFVMMNEPDNSFALRSLNDDFACIVNTYLPHLRNDSKKDNPENNIECPFGDLGLIDVLNKNRRSYKKTSPSPLQLDPYVALAVIQDQAAGRKEIPLNELLSAPCNIGRSFNLDAVSLLEVLRNIERLGEIRIIRTAGLDVVRIVNDRSFEDCVKAYYTVLNTQ